MTAIVQNILVIAIVLVCLLVVARQGFRTLTLRGRGKLGACCAKGCEAAQEPDKPDRVPFIPLENLSRRR